MNAKLIDIKDMPDYNPIVKNGITSVSEGKIFWTDNNSVTCREHGACLCLNKERTIWRCPACNEGAYVFWFPSVREIYAKLDYRSLQELLNESFGKNAKYHTIDEIPLFKLIEKIASLGGKPTPEAKL